MAWSEPEDMVTKAKPLGLPLSRSWGMKQSCEWDESSPASGAGQQMHFNTGWSNEGRAGPDEAWLRPATPQISNKQAAHLHVAVGGEQVAQLIHAGPPGNVSHVQLNRHPVPAFPEPNRTETSRKKAGNGTRTRNKQPDTERGNVVGEGGQERSLFAASRGKGFGRQNLEGFVFEREILGEALIETTYHHILSRAAAAVAQP